MNELVLDIGKKVLVTAIFAALIAVIWDPIKDNYQAISLIEYLILAAVLLFSAAIDFDVFGDRRIRMQLVIPYAVGGACLLFLIAQQSKLALSPGLSLIVVSIVFFGLRSLMFFKMSGLGRNPDKRPPLGHAVTSILFEETNDGGVAFILVKNTNLNGERHLWLSPGGKWTPALGDPASSLVEKIAAEVNLRAELWEGMADNLLLPPVESRQDEACVWYNRPHILLLENLQSPVANFPTQHLDMLYICKTAGVSANRVPKYSIASQIRVKVEDCIASVEAAQTATLAAIDEWSLSSEGQRQSIADTITRDLIWRLHLAAKAISGLET